MCIFSVCSQVGLVPGESSIYVNCNILGHFRRNDAILLEILYIDFPDGHHAVFLILIHFGFFGHNLAEHWIILSFF